MRAAAKRRGVEITSLSRPIQPSDFQNFDLILAMDKQNRGMQDIKIQLPKDYDSQGFHLLCNFPLEAYHECLLVGAEDILEALERWKFRESLPQDAHKKVSAKRLL